jgi:hypothetical protein
VAGRFHSNARWHYLFHCQEGVFMSPDWWHLSMCLRCQGNRFASCALCLGEGWVTTPREDFHMEDLRADWRAIGERNRFRDHPLPLAIAERVRWADLR